jgi:parvulin-like peptidyl-prolyl isomerase
VYGRPPGGQAPAGPAASAATAGQSSSPDKIVLRVGEASATQGEIEGFIEGLPPEAQKTLAKQGRRPIADEFVLMLVLSQQALNHHLDSTPAFRQMLALQHRELLARTAYREIVQQAVVTPEEISKYFAAHQSDFAEAQIQEVVIRKKPEGAKEGTPGLTAEEAKTRAEEIRKALSSGDDPKKVAEKYQVPNVVRVDPQPFSVHHGNMRADMEKAAFELKDGQVSEVFDVGQDLMFFKVVSHKAVDLRLVSSQIGNKLQQQKIKNAVDALKKDAKVWIDEGYFGAPSPAGAQGGVKPQVLKAEPATPK